MAGPLSPVVRVAALVLLWLVWVSPFFVKRVRRETPAAQTVDRRARWGIVLVGMGFGTAMTHSPAVWSSPLPVWRLVAGVLVASAAILMAWSGVNNLGRQWRVDAGLNADHELVTSGAYRVVRHPIYASMFGMLLTAIALVGTMPGIPIALILFSVGTEVRIHVEDALLQGRFGPRFTAWQKAKPAWIPFIR